MSSSTIGFSGALLLLLRFSICLLSMNFLLQNSQPEIILFICISHSFFSSLVYKNSPLY